MNTLKDKSICFKIKGYVGNLIVLKKSKTKNKKAPPPKQKEFMLPRVSKTSHCATKRVNSIHIPHQFYNTKYILCKIKKNTLKVSFCGSLIQEQFDKFTVRIYSKI